jgi:preprotein translocase subunit SecG
MYQVVTVFVILVSILLILIVLVQNSKGGGLASNFSSSNQVMGVRKTGDFLEKATWTLAGFLLALAFVSVMVLPRSQRQSGSAIDEELQNMPSPTQEMPNFGIGGEEGGASQDAQNAQGDSLQ